MLVAGHQAGDAARAAGQIAGETVPPFQAALWTPNGSGGYTYTDISAQLPSPIISTAMPTPWPWWG